VSEIELATGSGETELWANDSAIQIGREVDADAGGAFAYVRLRLPGPDKTPLVYGDLELRFKGVGDGGCPVKPATTDPRSLVASSPQEGAEELLLELREALPSEERTRFEQRLAPREALLRPFSPVVPTGKIVPVGSASVEDRPPVCPTAAALIPEGVDAEKTAVCDVVQRLPKAKVAQDQRLGRLLKECVKPQPNSSR
jgi:hypothetical protein